MSKLPKYSAAILLLLLTSIILTMALAPMTAVAQEDTIPPEDEQIPPSNLVPPPTPPLLGTLPENKGGVIVVASLGGTTNPAPGEYTFDNQSRFTIEATPFQGFRFAYWVISGAYLPGHNLPPVVFPVDAQGEEGIPPTYPPPSQLNWDSLAISQNPLDVIHGYGYVYQYQAVFLPTSTPTSPVVGYIIVKSAVGGSTNPKAGTYSYSNDATVSLTATADEGYVFQYWVISGGPLPGHGTIQNSQVTDNPFTTHSVKENTYQYQPVFALHSAGTPVEYFYAAIIILAIIAVIGIAAALMFRSRSKK